MTIHAWHLVAVVALATPVAVGWAAWRCRSPLLGLGITAFLLYLVAVAHVTVLPLRLGDAADPGVARIGADLVLTPFFAADGMAMSRTQLIGNLLLGVPFGAGLRLLTPWRLGSVLLVGLVFCVGIEVAQALLSELGATARPRITDINDVLLNMAGVVAGAAGVALFAWQEPRADDPRRT